MSKCNHVAPYFACVMCAGTIIVHDERHHHAEQEFTIEAIVERLTPAAVTSGSMSGVGYVSSVAYATLTNATP